MPHLCHDLQCPEQESSGEQLTIPSSSTTTPMSRASVSLSLAFVRRAVIHWQEVQVHCVQRGAGSSPPRLSVSLSIAPLRPRDILNGFPIKQW